MVLVHPQQLWAFQDEARVQIKPVLQVGDHSVAQPSLPDHEKSRFPLGVPYVVCLCGVAVVQLSAVYELEPFIPKTHCLRWQK